MRYLQCHTPTVRSRQLPNDFQRLFDDFFTSSFLPEYRNMEGPTPALNIWEDEKGYHVEVEVPGFSLEELDISVVGSEITISGEQKVEKEDSDGKSYYRQERRVGSFKRTLELPSEVNIEKVEASLKEGLLKVTLPRAQSTQPSKVKIRA